MKTRLKKLENLIESLSYLDMVIASNPIPFEIVQIVSDMLKEGKGMQAISKYLRDKYNYDLEFSAYKKLRDNILTRDRAPEPGKIIVDEGAEGYANTGYGGHDGSGVFVQPKSSLNKLAASAEDIIKTEYEQLRNHNFSNEEVMVLAEKYAQEFRNKTQAYLDAKEELENFTVFVKEKIYGELK